MKHFSWWLVIVPTMSAVAALGCALTEKAEVLDIHYYAAEAAPRPTVQPVSAAVPKNDAKQTVAPFLRIGRVSAGSHLGKKLVFRTSTVAVGIYDDRRWTERPDEYLRRALAGSLFDSHRVTQSLGGASPTLDVELLAFEEIRSKGQASTGRVAVRYALQDEKEVLLSDVVTIDIRAKSVDPEEVVRAISTALAQASEQIAERVTSRLGDVAPAAAPARPEG